VVLSLIIYQVIPHIIIVIGIILAIISIFLLAIEEDEDSIKIEGQVEDE
jgi:hypothetical protein